MKGPNPAFDCLPNFDVGDRTGDFSGSGITKEAELQAAVPLGGHATVPEGDELSDPFVRDLVGAVARLMSPQDQGPRSIAQREARFRGNVIPVRVIGRQKCFSA